jgi:hypothetical protein
MNAKQRFDRRLAIKITDSVSTMNCSYYFTALALISLPAAIHTHDVVVIVAWIAQTFLQLVLLSVIMVGQSIQNEKHNSHSKKLDAIATHLTDIKEQMGTVS